MEDNVLEAEGEADVPRVEEEAARPVRPKRMRRPNTRIVGPMWQAQENCNHHNLF